MRDWMWFVVIILGMLCVTIIVISALGRQDLKKFKEQLPKLPPIQEQHHDHQEDFRDR